MPHRVDLAAQRVIILKMMLEVFRTYSAVYFGTDHYGQRSADIILIAAIMIGQAEGRPMNVSKLAAFSGIPRATVIRKLKAFEDAGLVEEFEGAMNLLPAAVNRHATHAAVRTTRRLIVDAAARLSRMDT